MHLRPDVALAGRMCRILAVHAPTIKQTQEILANFRKQAAECKPGADGKPGCHRDGWGLVAFAPGELRFLARRATDASEDPYYERAMEAFKNMPRGAGVLGHIRDASTGGIRLENTHPFQADGWAFAHNGTIWGKLEDPNTTYQGDTDSERFFKKLLKHKRVQPTMEDALRRTIHELEGNHATYSSLVFVMTNGHVVHAYRRVGIDPKGVKTSQQMHEKYALAFAKQGKATILTQEPTHLGALEDWTEVPDDHFVTWTPGKAPEVKPLGLLAKTA
jgi:predicted glutamine amidotransferase